jgi:hypothetical protein
MDQNGSSSSEQDNMFDAIEEAVDNLFTQYEKKDDQGAPAVAAAPTQALELETNADLDKACGKVADLLADLNQALLTIDWEVSEANISKARSLLTAIRQEMALAADSIVAKLIDLMDQVLKAIGTAPESVPTSGPKALQDSLDTLTQAAMQGAALDATTKNLIETAIEELKDSLPAAGSAQAARSAKAAKVKETGPELHMEEKDTETVPAPAALLNIMRTNLSALEQVTNRLAPVENLFTQKPGYEKLVAIYRKLRETMNHQKTVLSTALKLEYHAAPSTSAAPVPAELRQDIQAHINVLGQCVNRINPVAALFAKSPKFAKLHTIHEKLRTQIEQQIDTFTRALQGDYKPPVFVAECSTPPSADIPCPWPKVRLGQWRGKTVAFIPESVAYEKGANRWTKTHLGMLAVFPLRKLKPWPWSRLRTLLNGTLATQQESTLKDLTLPVLNHPDPIQPTQPQLTADTLCILYSQDKGGVILLDQPTTEVVVQENWKWQPSKRTASIISGTLKTAEANIPVIDLNLL